MLVGEHFAQTARALLEQGGLGPSDVTAIASHGQTVLHSPSTTPGFTVQIGDPNRIVAATGCDVVSDFRRADLAVGGEGAPLAPLFHAAFFRPTEGVTAVLNLGGIANVSILDAAEPHRVLGFDTGPANTLLDQWCQKNTGNLFDKFGSWAASGDANNTLLKHMLSDPYFSRAPPKSTGREYFNLPWLEQFEPARYPAASVQRTLVELTVQSIRAALGRCAPNLDRLIVCGGGANNRFLVERLQASFGVVQVHSTAALGVLPQWVECAGFAWLAKATLERQALDLRSITGSKRLIVLGAIHRAAR